MKNYILLFIFFSAVLARSCNQQENKQSSQPNIILIMSDDMGYSDIGCYGGEIRTPNLDALSANGLRFTQFYNTARCCPTRASLLTGLHPHQAGIGHMTNDRGNDAYRGDLNQSCVTIAEVLRTAGYSTYMTGKWHVTPLLPSRQNPDKHNWPLQRGFDRFFGTIFGAGSFFDPNSLTSGNEFIAPDNDFYYTDAISDTAVKFINEHDTDKPFFLYVPYTAAHWPMHALPEDIAKYKGVYDEGWDEIRIERYERMLEMGLVRPEWGLSTAYPEKPWEETELKEWHAACMEVYAAMIDNMDQGIGRIVNALKGEGLYENTLIFFLQDNGACAESYAFNRRGGDTYIGYDKNWSNASNTPFRMFKHWTNEGGIATPLIVHWPEGFDAKGEFRWQPGQLVDIMATCVDVATADYPTEFNSNYIKPMEGISLVPAFNNLELDREYLYWEHEGNRAIRKGKWKLVSEAWSWPFMHDSLNVLPLEKWELYNLEADRTELHNLAKENPDLVNELAVEWQRWAEHAEVVPKPPRVVKMPSTVKKRIEEGETNL